MAEETTNPVQTVPEQAAPPVQEVPPVPEAPQKPRESNALLIFLTVLLILVGIADLVLWSVAGYQFVRKAQFVGGREPVQSVSSGGAAPTAYAWDLPESIELDDSAKESAAGARQV